MLDPSFSHLVEDHTALSGFPDVQLLSALLSTRKTASRSGPFFSREGTVTLSMFDVIKAYAIFGT